MSHGFPSAYRITKVTTNIFYIFKITTNIFQGARAVAVGKRITQRAVVTLAEWIQCLARMPSDGGSGAVRWVRSPPASKLFSDVPHTRLK
ncbi:Putative ATP-dependent DNA helicase R568 [Frankliniella fusca]|uniref:ATP-dependent DNA helicase R568 n=1 Tax=Frankliniella fusca TaxID=407009 RepID=A0AAE1LCV5_9NEOP|nr:Putative ATP-dependent DNA helicase R568 [Frankliniella fusca]KAK3914394.1 Putative ATP-dependent DNA helicase R568 [Frankliniella fusca]KAK3915381.1 Putative ATP-dependent DNA helicase R568 [Frankliniella fusca]